VNTTARVASAPSKIASARSRTGIRTGQPNSPVGGSSSAAHRAALRSERSSADSMPGSGTAAIAANSAEPGRGEEARSGGGDGTSFAPAPAATAPGSGTANFPVNSAGPRNHGGAGSFPGSLDGDGVSFV